MHTYEVLVESTGTSPCKDCPTSCPWKTGDPLIVTMYSSFKPLDNDEIFPPKPGPRQNAKVVANNAFKRVDTLIRKFKRVTGLTMTRHDALAMATGKECGLMCEEIPNHVGCIFRCRPMSITQKLIHKP
jgi:hypothetical protein